MKLLVTNDDGIDSVFLQQLVAALAKSGHELYVVAPVAEQSWTGASKTRNRAVKSSSVERGFGCPTWTVDGTPSDCVNIALAHLLPTKMDAVVSGINIGFNCTLGFILASGTIAGAWEGALHGLPTIAFSQDVTEEIYLALKQAEGTPDEGLLETLRTSAAHAARFASELLPVTPPRSFTVHNVNFPFPCKPNSEIKRTVPAHYFTPGFFSPANDEGSHRMIWAAGVDVSPKEPLTDLACIAAQYISHSVLDYRQLGRL